MKLAYPAEPPFKDLKEQKHLLQAAHSITLGISVVVPVEVGCCVSLHSGGMSTPAGEPLCGAY